MKPTLAHILIVLTIPLSIGTQYSNDCATCYGDTPCRACKNCRYCRHCAKEGGTCGVCRMISSQSTVNPPISSVKTEKPKLTTQKPKPTTQSLLKGRWQGIEEPRQGIEFKPTGPKEGIASFYYDSNIYEKTRFVIDTKNHLALPDRGMGYRFEVGSQNLVLIKGKVKKWFRRVKVGTTQVDRNKRIPETKGR